MKYKTTQRCNTCGYDYVASADVMRARIKELERRIEEFFNYVGHKHLCAILTGFDFCDCGYHEYLYKVMEGEREGLK